VAALLRQLFELCLLRRGPQDLPYSPAAALGLMLALVAVQVAMAQFVVDPPLATLVGRALITAGLVLAVPAWLLRLRGMANRTVQTQLAMAGSGLLFALAMVPVALVVLPAAQQPPAPTAVSGLALMASLTAIVLFVWKLRVDAAIWRQSLELPVGAAYVLAVSLVLAEFFLVLGISPPVPAAPAS
jgi:hypothetical protein